MIVKLWDIDSPVGANEALFYRTCGALAGARIPHCFYAAVDRDTKRGVLILEDLGPVVQGDCLQQLPLHQAQALVRSLASVHAAWVQHARLESAGWLPSHSPWVRDASWFAPRRMLFLERFGDRLDGFARSLLDQLERAPAIANERLIGAAVTLLHAGLHLDNIVFERDTEPVILDWARCAGWVDARGAGCDGCGGDPD